uniref:Uncharacterized protein n=1 Tax=Arundo donax TaxID=35708 RepID=A0A0A9HJX3_ARUDO
MHEHLELVTLLGELAQVLHSHHVHIQRHIVSFVEVGGCSNVDNDVDLLG